MVADAVDLDDPADLRCELRWLEYERDEAERRLHEAEALITALEDEVSTLTHALTVRRLAMSDASPTAGLGRVALLVRARSLMRRALHPDARPADEGAQATKDFQDAELFFGRVLARAT